MHLNGGQVVPCRKQMAGCWWPLVPNRAGNHARRHCRVQAPLTKNLGKVNDCNGKTIGTYNISKNFKDVWICLGTILIFQKWVWVNTYRYIFIHLPAILGFTRYQGFDLSPSGVIVIHCKTPSIPHELGNTLTMKHRSQAKGAAKGRENPWRFFPTIDQMIWGWVKTLVPSEPQNSW